MAGAIRREVLGERVTRKATTEKAKTSTGKRAPVNPASTNPLDEPPPNKGGRPRYVVNYEQLRQLCGIRCTGRECAAVLGVKYDTLDQRLREDFKEKLEVYDKNGELVELADGFREFFRVHSVLGKASLRRAIWESAIKDRAPSMLRYLGDNVLRIGNPADRPPPGNESEIPPEEMREYTRETLREELVKRGLPTHLLTN